jgi:hypothetical protein
MDWMNQLGGLLGKYAGGQTPREDEADRDFDQVSRNAPRESLANGIGEAFRSDRTPPFAQMVSQLFSRSDGNQKAGILSMLGGNRNDADRVAPEQVRQMAERAEQQDPSIIDKLSNFYAEHPTLVKTLGATAIGVALSKMAGGRGRAGGLF